MVDIEQYELTRYGKIMFRITEVWSHFICKHKYLYYILTWTWGFIMSFIGLVVDLFLLWTGHKRETYYWIHYYKIKENQFWGGVSLGSIFLRDFGSIDKYINSHEFGHTMQNTLLGPFAIFLCFIPSAIRYWVRNANEKKGKENKPYDNIWYEASASECGKYVVNYLEERKNG